jgi:hypothetical protein
VATDRNEDMNRAAVCTQAAAAAAAAAADTLVAAEYLYDEGNLRR